jgi:hypothetical protein
MKLSKQAASKQGYALVYCLLACLLIKHGVANQ